MTISKRMVTVVLTIVMLVSLIPAAVFAAGINGWKEESGVWLNP